MYVVVDRLSGTYYTGMPDKDCWNTSFKFAAQLTKLRAEELVDSLNVQVARGWINGEYAIVPYDKIKSVL